MSKTKVNTLVNDLMGRNEEQRPHVQTIKITDIAHAKLRALADYANRNKTPLAADLLMAAIDDAIEALPNEPLSRVEADKLRGIVKKFGAVRPVDQYPIEGSFGLRDIVLERADIYISHDERERWEEEDRAAAVAAVSSSNENGVAH
jgi:plasmid stabilization system protein ParE